MSAVREALAALEGHVLEIGSSGMHDAYPSQATVEVYDPKKRVGVGKNPVVAKVSTLNIIPDRKYDAIVVPYVYELLDAQKAQELSTIIGERMAIGARLLVIEHVSGGFFARLFGKWKGTTIEHTKHGLKRADEQVDDGVLLRVYERSVL